MTFKNNLCLDSRCNGSEGCVHRGPRGQFCYFFVEQELCSLLGLTWEPKLELNALLCMVRDRLPTPNDPPVPILEAHKEPEI